MYQKSSQFVNGSLFSCESKLIGILYQNFCYMMRMVPILFSPYWGKPLVSNERFAHFLKERLISKCQFCRKWTSNLLWKKNEEILMEILYFLSNWRFLVSVSVRPSFGGLISVSVSVRPKPKKSFRSLTNVFPQ